MGPPKQQNMGSITLNSSAQTAGVSKGGGMLSRLFSSSGGGSTSHSKRTVAGNVSNKPNTNSQSITTTTAGKQQKNVTAAAVPNYSNGGKNARATTTTRSLPAKITPAMAAEKAFIMPDELMDSNDARAAGLPTTITTLVDAASCITDEFEDTQQPQKSYHPPSQDHYRPLQQQQRPSGDARFAPPRRGMSMPSGMTGVTESASRRAMANMTLEQGGGRSATINIPISEQLRQSSQNNMVAVSEQLRQSQKNIPVSDQHLRQSFLEYYQNKRDNDFDVFDDEGGTEDYYDNSGGGLFDDAYMQSSSQRSSGIVGHHPRPLPPQNSSLRRTSQEYSEYSVPTTSYGGTRNESESSKTQHSTGTTKPVHQQKRRPTVEFDDTIYIVDPNTQQQQGGGGDRCSQPPRTVGQYEPRSSMRRTSMPVVTTKELDESSNKTDPTLNSSTQTDSTMRRSKIVNNNGRSNSVRMSISARENPKWFSIDESERTRPYNNHSNDNSNNIRGHDDYNMHHGGQMKFVRDDDDRTMATMATVVTMATKAQALNPRALNKAKDLMSPTGTVSIVVTDVQGSTALWESCPSDMKAAIDIHDTIMRQCYTNHHGYEINTEGDAFHLAFQHPADALAFALQAQLKLYKADWPDEILRHKDGKDEPALKLRGFRVRFGIHHGPTTCGVHEMTGRTVYVGEAVDIAKTVEKYCHGGQILTTMETWKAVSGMAERYLGRPQVLDCGEHLLFEKTHQPSGTATRYTRRIMQLVPSDLAFDFFESRGRRDVPSEDGKMGFEIKDSSAVNGRLFPPLQSKRQLTTCFLNAPYANGRVTICFIYTVGLRDDYPEMKSKNLGILANKYVRKNLLVSTPPGYECQEDNGCWMIAFDKMANAVNFGLQLKSALKEADDLVGTVDRDTMFKVGIVSGPFTSMGPHRITGMADYFGPIVNRTARVAMNCEPGQVCVGIPLSDGVTADPPDFGSTIAVKLLEIKKLKGITIDMAIFECSKRNIETPYI